MPLICITQGVNYNRVCMEVMVVAFTPIFALLYLQTAITIKGGAHCVLLFVSRRAGLLVRSPLSESKSGAEGIPCELSRRETPGAPFPLMAWESYQLRAFTIRPRRFSRRRANSCVLCSFACSSRDLNNLALDLNISSLDTQSAFMTRCGCNLWFMQQTGEGCAASLRMNALATIMM